jgi:hypothetical protein
MSDVQFVLSREQRDEISRATASIEECVKEMIAKPNAPAEIVAIWTNLTIIQSNLADLPQINSN